MPLVDSIRDLFGTSDVEWGEDVLRVANARYPVIDGVVILLPPESLPERLRIAHGGFRPAETAEQSESVQFSFGEEWQEYSAILPEHEEEFRRYFDLVDLDSLRDKRLVDLGCGIGRWSYFLKDRCRELVLIDFSEAIFVARKNLRDAQNTLFFLGDIRHLPFRRDFADFAFSLGVLHHLPEDALELVRSLRDSAPELLVYLYYALENRPAYFRLLLAGATLLRRTVSRSRSPWFRRAFARVATVSFYVPLIALGRALEPFGVADRVPLYDTYRGKSLQRIEQDAYDRFCTPIERRYTRAQIASLRDAFSEVRISERRPYWHFLCRR